MKAIYLFLALAAGAAESGLPAEIVAAHNAFREQAGVPSLAWSEKLALDAQDWADGLLDSGQFAHRPENPHGENLYEIVGGAATPRHVVERWAAEEKNFDYQANQCLLGMCGHYTQIVWRDTRRVGCAVARGGSREVWVCEYDPPGNYIGQRPY
jgi:uncharacterized protein YkwD